MSYGFIMIKLWLIVNPFNNIKNVLWLRYDNVMGIDYLFTINELPDKMNQWHNY